MELRTLDLYLVGGSVYSPVLRYCMLAARCDDRVRCECVVATYLVWRVCSGKQGKKYVDFYDQNVYPIDWCTLDRREYVPFNDFCVPSSLFLHQEQPLVNLDAKEHTPVDNDVAVPSIYGLPRRHRGPLDWGHSPPCRRVRRFLKGARRGKSGRLLLDDREQDKNTKEGKKGNNFRACTSLLVSYTQPTCAFALAGRARYPRDELWKVRIPPPKYLDPGAVMSYLQLSLPVYRVKRTWYVTTRFGASNHLAGRAEVTLAFWHACMSVASIHTARSVYYDVVLEELTRQRRRRHHAPS